MYAVPSRVDVRLARRGCLHELLRRELQPDSRVEHDLSGVPCRHVQFANGKWELRLVPRWFLRPAADGKCKLPSVSCGALQRDAWSSEHIRMRELFRRLVQSNEWKHLAVRMHAVPRELLRTGSWSIILHSLSRRKRDGRNGQQARDRLR